MATRDISLPMAVDEVQNDIPIDQSNENDMKKQTRRKVLIFAAIIVGIGVFIYLMVEYGVEFSGTYSGGYRPSRPKGWIQNESSQNLL